MCQTGGLMWLMSADHLAASDGGPVLSHTRHLVGDRFPPPVVFPACVSTRAPETRPLPTISCVQSARGGEVIPRPVVRGPMAIVLPWSRSPRTLSRPFWEHHCPLCQSSTGGDGVLSLAENGAGSGRRSPHPSPFAPQRLKHRQQIGH